MADLMPDPVALAATFATRCNYCHKRIMWAWTDNETRMPLDATPTPFGNVRAYQEGRRLQCEEISKREDRHRLILGGWLLYQHHRMSCPQADKWARLQKPPAPRVDTPCTDVGLW